MEENLLNEFIQGFKALQEKINKGEIPEKALFDIAKKFNQETGGKLSHYNSPLAVGVSVVKVEKDGEVGLLAFKRGINPFVGGIAFPGGFVDQNESSKEAAIRELKEETNLDLPEAELWTHIGEKKTPHNQLLIFYSYADTIPWEMVEKAYEGLKDKSESQGIVFLKPDAEMCFSLHAEIRDEVFSVSNKKKNKP